LCGDALYSQIEWQIAGLEQLKVECDCRSHVDVVEPGASGHAPGKLLQLRRWLGSVE
jgi:hypothetical protein